MRELFRWLLFELVFVIVAVFPGLAAAQGQAPYFEIVPNPSLVDEKVSVRLTGLEPNMPVVIRACLQDDFNQLWESNATFQPDPQGIVDLAIQKPITGTYSEVDPMGLFWSMDVESGPKGMAYCAKRGSAPMTFTAEVNGQLVASAELERDFVSADVIQLPVTDNGLKGVFFSPVAPGPYPCILIVGGSEGGMYTAKSVGALLASHGYATLALAYFLYPGLPDNLANIPLEYFEKAIQWVQSQPTVKSDQLAVLGDSRGGELALILGATFPQIKTVIAYVPSNVVAGAYGGNVAGQPAWLYHGLPLPYREIPVEKIQGPVLLITGKDDQLWQSSSMSDAIIKRLDEFKFPFAHKHLTYEGAGHGILFPYVPTTRTNWYNSLTGATYSLGGNAKSNALAQGDSWPQMLAFLADGLKLTSVSPTSMPALGLPASTSTPVPATLPATQSLP